MNVFDEIQAALRVLEAGGNGESPKLDFKESWYDMGNNSWAEEMAKDVAALANTPGPDGCLVFGVNKEGMVVGAPLRLLGLDEAEIQRQIARRIIPPPIVRVDEYVMQERLVTCLVVLRSDNRPHVLRSWRQRDNYIPIRRGTQTQPAGRYELDEMYSSRHKPGELRIGLTSSVVRSGHKPNSEHDILGALQLWVSNTSEEGFIVTRAAAECTWSNGEQTQPSVIGYNHDLNDQRGLGKLPFTVDQGRAWAANLWLNFGMLRNDLWHQSSVKIRLELVSAMHLTIEKEFLVDLNLHR